MRCVTISLQDGNVGLVKNRIVLGATCNFILVEHVLRMNIDVLVITRTMFTFVMSASFVRIHSFCSKSLGTKALAVLSLLYVTSQLV